MQKQKFTEMKTAAKMTTDEINTIRHGICHFSVFQYTDLWERVLRQTAFLDETFERVSPTQRLWHLEHDIDQVPSCLVCSRPLGFNKSKRCYKQTCGSAYCTQRLRRVEIPSTTFIERHSPTTLKLKCNTCGQEFIITEKTAESRRRRGKTVCVRCNPLDSTHSLARHTFIKFLRSVYPDLEILPDRFRLGSFFVFLFPDRERANPSRYNGTDVIDGLPVSEIWKETDRLLSSCPSILVWQSEWQNDKDDIKRRITDVIQQSIKTKKSNNNGKKSFQWRLDKLL